jgi:hypothetical protein
MKTESNALCRAAQSRGIGVVASSVARPKFNRNTVQFIVTFDRANSGLSLRDSAAVEKCWHRG